MTKTCALLAFLFSIAMLSLPQHIEAQRRPVVGALTGTGTFEGSATPNHSRDDLKGIYNFTVNGTTRTFAWDSNTVFSGGNLSGGWEEGSTWRLTYISLAKTVGASADFYLRSAILIRHSSSISGSDGNRENSATSNIGESSLAITPEERSVWDEVTKLAERDAYLFYLDKYPEGAFASTAKTEIKKIDGRDEDSIWKSAEATNTVESYKSYLNRYPDGRFAGVGSLRIKSLTENSGSKTPPIAQPGPIQEAQNIINGKAINLVAPEYPLAARANRLSAIVDVEVLIDEKGNVISAKAKTGNAVFHQAAEQAARKSRFSPTLQNRVPVKVSGIIRYSFAP